MSSVIGPFPSQLPLRLIFLLILCGLFLTKSSALEGQPEFHDARQGEFARSLRSYDVSIPSKVNEFGDHVTYSLRHFLPTDSEFLRRRRRRRDAGTSGSVVPDDDPVTSVHYKVNIEGYDVHLQLTANDGLFAPGLVIERRTSGNLTGVKGRKVSDDRCHFFGRVKGQSRYSVAMATCDGLHGFIRFEGKDFFIEPLKGHNVSEGKGHPHLVYRRSALPPELHHNHPDGKQERQGDREEGTCGVTDTEEHPEELRSRSSPRKGKVERKSRRKRSVSLERNVETLIVVDPQMVEYYKNDNIENYVFTIMNMVSTMFHDSSIGNAINIVLVKIIYLEQEQEDLKITHHADHTLSHFCRWQMGINPKEDDNPNHHDVAILLTRVNICSRMNEPCSTLGVSQVSGLCQPHRSCNINEDTGLALAFTVAHELGHNFGMKHDTLEHGCEAPAEGMQFVMSPQLTAEASPLVWSNCSQAAMTSFLDRAWGQCLDDLPSEHEFNFPVLPPGVMYDIDHQCRLLYGPDAEYCDGIDNLCTTVWCRVDKKCMTKLEAAAEGTICGDNEWCFGGRCVAIGEKPLAIDSQWGEWSGWSECTRTCGAGVSSSERLCNNPPPSHGGRYCLGERRRYHICNTDDCPDGSVNFRAHQCAQFNHVLYKGQKYQWEPVATQGAPCQLHCKPEGRLFSVMMMDMVIDGTPCKVGRKDMCISGRCRTVGCDWAIDSDAIEDRCGVCHGDGTTCKTVQENFEKKTGLGYVEAALIPSGARNIRVEEVAEASNYLAIRNDNGHYYLNGHWYIQWTGDYEAAGTVIQYRREGNMESFVAPGPIKEPLHVMLLFQSQNPGIRLEYTIPDENITERRRPEFLWKFSDWTHCTLSCGGGSQVSQVICMEKEAGIVEDSNCEPSTRPDDMYLPCNEHLCPAKWWSGPWQHCSVSCGDGGIKKRTVLCVRQRGPDEQIALEDWECEGLEKPTDSTPCRRKDPCATEDSLWQTGPWIGKCEPDDPCSTTQKRLVTCLEPSGQCNLETRPAAERMCPNTACGKWIVSDWTMCSRSCDVGTQFRTVNCVGGEACNRDEKPRGVRSCNANECPRSAADREKMNSNNALQELGKTVPTKIPEYQILLPITDGLNVTGQSASVPVEVTGSSVMQNSVENFTTMATDGVEKVVSDGIQWTLTTDTNEKVVTDGVQWTVTTDTSEKVVTDGVQWTVTTDTSEKVVTDGVQWTVTTDTSEKVVDDPVQWTVSTLPSSHSEKMNSSGSEFRWMSHFWSECSRPCGKGNRTRDVICIRLASSKVVPEEFCDQKLKPNVRSDCQIAPCVSWTTTEWQPCSATCVQHRNVTCLADNLCDPDERPEVTRICSTGPCAEWNTDAWSECSRTCGGGKEERIVRCINRVTQETVDTCDLQLRPPNERQCNAQECPKESSALEERFLPVCVSDAMATGTCHALRRTGKCAQGYVQRKCCESCRQWKHSLGGASAAQSPGGVPTT